MTLREETISLMANKGFEVLFGDNPEHITFQGMGNGKRVVVHFTGDSAMSAADLVAGAMREVAEQQ